MLHTPKSGRFALWFAVVIAAVGLIALVDSTRTAGSPFPLRSSSNYRVADENGVASANHVAGDANTEASIFLALANDPNLSDLGIRVAAHAGHVVLRSTAPNPVFKARAALLAELVVGVVAVDNELVVRGPLLD